MQALIAGFVGQSVVHDSAFVLRRVLHAIHLNQAERVASDCGRRSRWFGLSIDILHNISATHLV
jgi:hypothetical protein